MKFKYKIKLFFVNILAKKIEKYNKRKASYHEIGHFVFNILLGFKISKIDIDVKLENYQEIIDGVECISLEILNNSKNIIEFEGDMIFFNNLVGNINISEIMNNFNLTKDKIQICFIKYLIQLYAGQITQQTIFRKRFYEYIQKQYFGEDNGFNPNNDFNKAKILLNSISRNEDVKKVIICKINSFIVEIINNIQNKKTIKRLAKLLFTLKEFDDKEISNYTKEICSFRLNLISFEDFITDLKKMV